MPRTRRSDGFAAAEQLLALEPDAAARRDAGRQEPEDRARGQRLAAPRLADDPDRLPGADREVDVRDDRARGAAEVRLDPQPARRSASSLIEARPRSDTRSNSQSPITLTLAAVRTRASPGASAVAGFSKSSVRLSDSIRPQSAVPGPTPMPRNDSAASETSAYAKASVAFAIATGRTFGQMWHEHDPPVGEPERLGGLDVRPSRAARASPPERAVRRAGRRARRGAPRRGSSRRRARRRRRSRRAAPGSAKTKSATRMITESTRPPR